MSAGSYLGVLLTLAFVLGLVGLAAKLLRRFAPGTLTGRARLPMEVVQRLALSPRQGIAVVRVGGKVVAIATGEGGVRTLFELAGDDQRALGVGSGVSGPEVEMSLTPDAPHPTPSEAWIDEEALAHARRNAIIEDDAEVPAFLTTPVRAAKPASPVKDFSTLFRQSLKQAGVPFAALVIALATSTADAQAPATQAAATQAAATQAAATQAAATQAAATQPTAAPPTAQAAPPAARRPQPATRTRTAPATAGATAVRPSAAQSAAQPASRQPQTVSPVATTEQIVERLSPQMDLRVGGGAEQKGLRLSGTVGVVVMMGLLTLIPMMLLMMTSFTRIFIVLSFLKQALGTQSAPPAQLVAGLALLLTGFVMAPTFTKMNQEALQPWLNGQMEQAQMLEVGAKPFKAFMLRQTRPSDVRAFIRMSGQAAPPKAEDVPLVTLTSAFVTSELRTAFQIGFALFLPFIVIDIVVSSVLMSMGMMMLPPAMIALPFKLLLFVLVDGWSLVMQSLVASFR